MKNLYRRDSFRDYFPMPNEIFSLGLSCGEIAVYAYLMRCEERETFQCHPSYRTIGGALHMSENTVRKYVASLERCGLICTEPTQIITKSGLKRNGSLRYSILPIQNAVDLFHSRQMEQLEITAARQQVVEKAEGRGACGPVCASSTVTGQ